MSTKRTTILAAVVTALTGTTGVSTRIYRSRVEALTKAETPALVVEPVADNATRDAVAHLTWELVFSVMVIVRSDTPDTTAETTIESLHNKIMSDAPLQALVVDVVPLSVDWQFDGADKAFCMATVQFKVIYQTAETTIS